MPGGWYVFSLNVSKYLGVLISTDCVFSHYFDNIPSTT